MPVPRRRHPVWLVGLAIVALLLTGIASGLHPGSWRPTPGGRTVAAAGHVTTPGTARPATASHPSALSAVPHHLDLSSTGPTDVLLVSKATRPGVTEAVVHDITVDPVTPHGRGPPTL